MAGTTTYYGISYPTNTDYVKDGATAMQTIADGFDSAVAIPTYNNQTGTSYTFVLADAGKTVTSNNASAVTFTIPPQASVAWANNTTLTVRNLGAGVVTIAGGAGVTVTNTAQTVAQYGEVKLIRTASNAWTVAPAGGAGGLTLVKSQTIGSAVSSVTVTDAFNSTYDAYKVIITGGTSSVDNFLQVQLRTGTTTSTTGYYYAAIGYNYASAAAEGLLNNNTSSWSFLGYAYGTGGYLALNVDIINPFLAKQTIITNNLPVSIYAAAGAGQHRVSTSYDQLVINCASGNITGGTIYIYGYQK